MNSVAGMIFASLIFGAYPENRATAVIHMSSETNPKT